MAGAKPIAVYLESGAKRVFACALDWPGWCRSGKDEEAALAALAESADRYRIVADEAGVHLPNNAGGEFAVEERLEGGGGTDFGVPSATAKADERPLTARGATREAAFVAAAWTVFDRVVEHAPAELRKGPRGGGRDRDKIVEHVLAAEVAYARKIGRRVEEVAIDDVEAIAARRASILEVLRAARAGEPLADKGWLPRYAARRIAWHAIDHAWEIQDRTPD